MTIKLFQTDRVWREIGSEIIDLANSAHLKGQSQNGFLTKQLEETLSSMFNRKHCITVASCTDALDIVIQSLGLPKQSKIAVSDYTFTASAHAIHRAGHCPVPVDVLQDYCIDFEAIDNVDAIMSVDIFGNVSNYQALLSLEKPIIVDSAQSLESIDIHGIASPCYGIASCLSFSPSKTLSSWGSGGAILTDDDNIANQARQLRLHGKLKNSDLSIGAGLNSMMSTFECAAVLTGLRYINKWHARRKKIADYLIANSQIPTGIDLKIQKHTYSKLIFQSQSRSKIIKKFSDLGVETAIHYSRLISDENLYRTEVEPINSRRLKEISFTVPNQHTLLDSEVDTILEALK